MDTSAGNNDETLLRGAFDRAAPGEALSARQAERIAAETRLSLRRVERFALERGIVPQRYARNLGTVGREGQCRLLDACALVVGLGGLGGHVVETLARLGVGRIVGADPDAFDETNLNRQLLATTANLGQPKAEQARLRAAAVNAAVEFVGHAARFQSLADDVFAASDVVLDCLDRISARRELADRCAAAGVLLVHGAIAGWSGQVALCPPGAGVLDKLYAGKGDRGAEAELGTPPFTAAFAANLMAARAAAALLGRPVRPQVVFFDLLHGDWETADL